MSDAPERIWVQWPNGLAFKCQARTPGLRDEYVRADLALPAVRPRVKPLVWLQHPTRLGELFADAEFGAYSVSDPTGRGRWQWQWQRHLMGALLDQSNQELARAFPTRGDAIAAAEGHRKARILSALDNNTGKEVMPIEPRYGSAEGPSDIGPGDQAIAGAAQDGDVDAGVYDDDPDEIGILQARVEDQDRTIADLTRQLQGQPRRQSDVVAGAAPVTVQEAAQDIEAIENSGRRWHCEDHRVVSVRWEPYKPDGQRQMKAKGRWQEQVGAGDYWRWQNCERPVNLSALAQKGDSHE